MLGIGSTELVLILFFGFLIFGPEKLPEMGRTVGRAIKQFRDASDQVNAKFKEEVYDPFQEAIDPYKTELNQVAEPFKEDLQSINATFKETEKMLKDPLDLKGKKEEWKNPLQAAKEADKAEKEAKAVASTSADKPLSDAANAPKVEVSASADPFADVTETPAKEAPKKSMAASLYGLDDDAEGGEQ